ncbi:hypothetical protein [Fodinicola feengrottensis]|uniref:hypothetical protein n=1 Tax=Fodinicola feengrottensis TaxID=435914 RepID=UPI00244311E3|nr:hypothetical protein [Fodinicola feengrottensis]
MAVSWIPMIGLLLLPSGCRTAPPSRPWSDSALPMPASRVQEMWQPGAARFS